MISLGNFQDPQLHLLKTKLDNSAKIGKTDWNAYFEWYFEAAKQDQESEVASEIVLKLTEDTENFKEKMASKATCSPSAAWSCPPHSSSSVQAPSLGLPWPSVETLPQASSPAFLPQLYLRGLLASITTFLTFGSAYGATFP